jgi:hypothetical protein
MKVKQRKLLKLFYERKGRIRGSDRGVEFNQDTFYACMEILK